MGKFEKLIIDTPVMYQALVLIFQKLGPTLESVACMHTQTDQKQPDLLYWGRKKYTLSVGRWLIILYGTQNHGAPPSMMT